MKGKLKWEKWTNEHYIANGLTKGHTTYDVKKCKFVEGWSVEIKFMVNSLRNVKKICEGIERVEGVK